MVHFLHQRNLISTIHNDHIRTEGKKAKSQLRKRCRQSIPNVWLGDYHGRNDWHTTEKVSQYSQPYLARAHQNMYHIYTVGSKAAAQIIHSV